MPLINAFLSSHGLGIYIGDGEIRALYSVEGTRLLANDWESVPNRSDRLNTSIYTTERI